MSAGWVVGAWMVRGMPGGCLEEVALELGLGERGALGPGAHGSCWLVICCGPGTGEALCQGGN